MSCTTQIADETVSVPFRAKVSKTSTSSTRPSSNRKLQSECRQIRNEWSCEEEGRRRRMADVMQVRLLDALTV